MYIITLSADCAEDQIMGVKETLKMYLERFGDIRVVEVKEIKQEQMKIKV